MIRVCSGFSPSGYEQYGKRFLDTFHKFWPADVDLKVYTEQPVEMPRGHCRSLWDCGGVGDFIARHKDNLERNGRMPNKHWRPRHIKGGYNFRFDAVKFCRQCFIPRHAASDLVDGDVLVWLDADVVTLCTVPKDFIIDLMRGEEIAFLGRIGTHSEIGFWCVRINDRTRSFIDTFAETWASDEVFHLPEWHSAFVFDYCRKAANLRERHLTPNGRGHVWMQSPLAKYTDHCKGERKALGFSPERKRT